jgi:cardiolipin synthase
MRPKLLLPSEYVAHASKNINKAKKRVYFLAMVVAKDSSSSPIIDSLITAAKRGVDVNVAADTFTYMELSGYFFPTYYRNKKSRETTQMVKDLTMAGAKFDWLGKSKSTIVSGRTHTKLCIVDDIVYCFGGVNLYDGGIASNDYMFVQEDKYLADKLSEEYEILRDAEKSNSYYKSHEFAWKNNSVLVDGGIIGNSIIYKRACELVREAGSIIYVSQYPPTGKLGHLIRKIPNQLYFNPTRNANLANSWVIKFGEFFSKNQTLYNHRQYLHGKFMIITKKNGEKVAITGSHNFVYGGVLLGIREMALETSDPEYIKQLEKFVQDKII